MRHDTLQTKLAIRLFLVLTGIGLLFGVSLNQYLRAVLEAEVSDKANLVFSNLQAVQTYVREILRPVMFESLPHDDFIIEAMSTSYVTRKVMSDLNVGKDQFSYRRVALSPRNPEYAANATGARAHRPLRGQSLEATHFSKLFPGQGRGVLHHGPAGGLRQILPALPRPARTDAPGVLLSRYGEQAGFGRHEGEIAGLDSLIIPVERQAEAIKPHQHGLHPGLQRGHAHHPHDQPLLLRPHHGREHRPSGDPHAPALPGRGREDPGEGLAGPTT